VKVLLDSRATGMVISLEFARKQGFKLKKLERPMNVRNVDGLLNKEGHRERTDRCNRGTKVDGNLGDAMASSPQSGD